MIPRAAATIPLEVDVPARETPVDPGTLPGGAAPGGAAPGGVGDAADPAIADILAQTGGSPLWLLAALAAAVVVVGLALALRRRGASRRRSA